jgi:hypothetical protein
MEGEPSDQILFLLFNFQILAYQFFLLVKFVSDGLIQTFFPKQSFFYIKIKNKLGDTCI